MATKVNKKTGKSIKFGLIEFIRGEFLVSDDFKKLWPLFLEIFIGFFFIIYCSHLINQKTKKINQLKDEVEEVRSQSAYIKSKLINIKLESEIEKNLDKDSVNNPNGLTALENHPLKIVLKLNKNNHVTK